ncbi:PSDC domain protein, putative, partial [Rhizoctonia solani AG-3 Rhs1AP]
MRVTGESEPRPVLQEAAELPNPVQIPDSSSTSSTEPINTTNNVGTGANTVDPYHITQPVPDINVRELMERSNQLAERFNQLLERSNELVERCAQPIDQSHSSTLSDQFNRVLERLIVLVEHPRQPTEHSDALAERFNQLLERFNQLMEQSKEPAHRANELAEKANQLMEQLGESSEYSNELSEQTASCWDRMGDVLGNINRVLVGVQHAIVRNHKGNKINAIDCLVNEQGRIPVEMHTELQSTLTYVSEAFAHETGCLVEVLFYGISDGFCDPSTGFVADGLESDARDRLHNYFSSCLG